MEKRGLVQRSPDPTDLRSVLVDITPKGREAHRDSLAKRVASAVVMLSELDQADLDSLSRLWRR
jgi:DNA-binding MarR family transcriptional regulator